MSDVESTSSPTRPKDDSRLSPLHNSGEEDDDAPVEREGAGRVDKGKQTANDEEADDDDEDAEEDEDEDDEDEDSDDEGGRRGRKRRKPLNNRYLDLEVEVDDDDEDLDEDENELAKEDGFIDKDLPDETDDARRRSAADNARLDRLRREQEDMSNEQLAKELRQRYRRTARYAAQSDYAEVPQRMLMPSVEDPNLWGVPVKPGREAEIILTLNRKFMATLDTPRALQIISAFFRDSIPGRIYVETRKADYVIQACEGIPGCYARTVSSLFLVPIEEMADLLRITKVRIDVPIGGYVRFKNGKYAGDLAEVVEKNGEELDLKFIPRIDMNPKDATEYTDSQGRKRKKGDGGKAVNFRPPQRLFKPEDVAAAYPKSQKPRPVGRSSWIFEREEYIDGFCHKAVKISQVRIEGITPTLEEITRFKGSKGGSGTGGNESAGVDLSFLANAGKKDGTIALQPGDHVEVFEGEQAGVEGTVSAVGTDVVTIDVEHEELIGQRVDVEISSVRKRFRPGDHIKVITGQHEDETGLVVKVEDNVTTFLSDLSLAEVSVFSKDIREAAEVGSGVNIIGGYELHNLVQIDSLTAGVIFKIEREQFRILDQNGISHAVVPSQVSMRKDTSRAVALDSEGSEIHAGDMMKEIGGSRRQGKVLHLYLGHTAFLHNRDNPENNGVFAARANTLSPLAPKGGSDLSKMNPAIAARTANGGGTGPQGGGQIGMRLVRSKLEGKHVQVIKGQYKLQRGIIKSVTGNMARVELNSSGRALAIDLKSLVGKDADGKSFPLTGPGAPGGPPAMGASAPLHMGNFNPAANPYSGNAMGPPQMQPPQRFPGSTPAYVNGGRTPAYNPYDAGAGGKTPAYNPYGGGGGKTPAHNPYGDGSKTPAYNPYGDGSKTPAYDPYGGSKTPAYNPYGGGEKTPNPYSSIGDKTPAHDPYGGSARSDLRTAPYSSYAAPTPGAGYAAPTPGVGYAAPTPGAGYGYSAPTPAAHTPGVGLGEPTPFGAPTPHGAPTPAIAPTPAPGSSAWGGPPPSRTSASPLLIPGIAVKVGRDKSTGSLWNSSTTHLGQSGRVLSVQGRSCDVQLDGGARLEGIPDSFLEPVRPKSNGQAFVALDPPESRGRSFKVGSIDDGEVMAYGEDGSQAFFSIERVAVMA